MKLKKLSWNPVRQTLAFIGAVALFSSAESMVAQTINNPSFEADTFGAFPGYISVNGPITGWVGSPPERVGINPAGGQAPFADNAIIPHGTQAAFIQSYTGGSSTLSTEITGLTAGQKYMVNFRLNARAGQTPFLKVGVDGQPILNMSTTGLQASGTKTAAYRYAAFEFTAAGETAQMWLTNDVNGDTTVIVDDFSIAPSTTGWSYAPWTGDANAVDPLRTYTHAYNFGGGAAPDTTINGVFFKGVVGANPNVAREFWIQGLGSPFNSDDVNNVSGSSATIAKRFIYAGNPGYFSIAGLVPGMEYVATFYSVGWDAPPRAQTFSYGNDRLTVNQGQLGENNGIAISYRYVAPASGAITLLQSPTLPANSLHLYGFANSEANPQPMPVMGVQPKDQVSRAGSTASFSITAGGGRPLSFQWYKNESEMLPGQTNRFLTLSNLASVDLGGYSVVVNNANGSVTSRLATLTFGSFPNPSFEADVFPTWPGYVNGNTPITGWTASDPARVGLNPMTEFAGPFANTGAIPEGQQAAFLQYATGTGTTLGTTITDLEPAENYMLRFRANARDYNNTKPTLRVAIDGQLIGEMRLMAVGGTNEYRHAALSFVPANGTVSLTLTNNTTDSAIVDDFSVVPFTTKWSYAQWNDDATSGADPMGRFSHAYNFGAPGLAVDTMINGIRFRGVPGANPTVSNVFSTANLTGAFAGDSNLLTGVSGGSPLMARTFVYYAGTIPGDVFQTITLTNLIPGVEYQANIFGVGFDVKSYARSATFMAGDDYLTINEDHFGLDAGIRVSYRYVADASGSITLKYQPTDRASSFHTYGFSNEELNSSNPPNFYRQPQGRVVAGGSPVMLDAAIGGQVPLFLQWQKDGVDLINETNQVLMLSGVTSDTGGYTLVVSNAVGVITSIVARVDVGLTMVNASFEADVFTNFPGYVVGNFPITGWTASLPVQMGINPVSDGQSPFANVGTIPDGNKVAFLQVDGAVLSQVITGMVPGKTYYLNYYENARSGYNAPTATVTLGGETIVPAHVVNAGEYARLVSAPFLATTDSAELAFIKNPGPAGGDSTLVIDNVALLELPPTAPGFIIQPAANQYVIAGEAVTLQPLVTGTLPMTYQWQLNGSDLSGQTSPTLVLNNIDLAQGGNYQLIASNQFGMNTSMVAVVRVGWSFTELYNTGVDNSHVLAEGGLKDAHYTMTSSADLQFPGPDLFVLYDVWPATNGIYLTNGPVSKWLSPRADLTNVAGSGNLPGLYRFQTTFVLDTVNPATAQLDGKLAVDNEVLDILLNGQSTGITNVVGYANMTPFVISNGFVAGTNTLEFVVTNTAPTGPVAMRADLHGVAMPLPPTLPQITEPANQTVIEAQDTSFTTLAIGSGPLYYQWYYEGFDLPGETSRTLRLSRVSADQAGSYSVIVSNSVGSVTSQVAVLTVLVPPQVLTGPFNQSVELNDPASFGVVASGTEPLSYQWYFGTTLLEGETGPELLIASVGVEDLGEYSVVVSNVAGSVTSPIATLTLNNNAPVAGTLATATSVNQPVTVAVATVLAQCSDPDGDTLVVDAVSNSTNGAVVTLVGQEITYTPVADFAGVDQFSYSIADGKGGTAVGTITVEVYPGNLPLLNLVDGTKVAEGFRIRFAGVPGRSYEVERALVITGPWTNIANVVALPTITPYTDQTAPSNGNAFYRIKKP